MSCTTGRPHCQSIAPEFPSWDEERAKRPCFVSEAISREIVEGHWQPRLLAIAVPGLRHCLPNCDGVLMAVAVSPDVVVYVCTNCIPQGGRLPRQWNQDGAHVLVREVPCSGKMDGQYLFHALEGGTRASASSLVPRASAIWRKATTGPRFAFAPCSGCWRRSDWSRSGPNWCTARPTIRPSSSSNSFAAPSGGSAPSAKALFARQGRRSMSKRFRVFRSVCVRNNARSAGRDFAPARRRSRAGARDGQAFRGQGPRPGHQRQSRPGSMSALAAASLVAAEGVEPILHVTTRDRNRIALVSEALGAQALGIRNLLCTSGTPPDAWAASAPRRTSSTSTRSSLLQAYAHLAGDGSLVGERGIAGAGPFCLGAVASPDADPLELQVSRLAKKVSAGAAFLITQPVFDLERFDAWWKEVTRRGIHEKVAILAGIQPLPDAELAKARDGQATAAERFPQSTLDRVGSADESGGASARRRSRSPWRRSSGFRRCRGCAASASAATATATPPWRSSRNPAWGATSRACQVRHPYQAGRARACGPWASWGSSIGARTARVATTA